MLSNNKTITKISNTLLIINSVVADFRYSFVIALSVVIVAVI